MGVFFFCKHKTSYEMRIVDWGSDVCSSDLPWLRSVPVDEHPVDPFDGAFHLGAEGMVGVAKLNQLAVGLQRGRRSLRSGLDARQGPFDPVDCLHRQFIRHGKAIA